MRKTKGGKAGLAKSGIKPVRLRQRTNKKVSG
jgi:hypothetical protein